MQDLITTPPLVPLDWLAPSPTNPRKRFSAASISELAESIAAHGLAQPILARPVPGAVAGEVPFEIVAGERRWRACQLLAASFSPQAIKRHDEHGGFTYAIPCVVRELSDQQVLALQLAENIHREDLHPMEEAAHYHRMRTHPTEPRSVEQISRVAGVTEQRVYQRLSLMQLAPAAVEAFMADRINLRLALQVARMPQAVQPELVEHLANWGGEPMGPKAAAKFIQDRYMLRLAVAPFDTADATLYPDAGPCGTCLKRTGANPDLFGDVSDADTCTDTACFQVKKTTQRDRMAAELAETGYTVLRGDEARDACAGDGRGVKPGWHLLEDAVPVNLGDATLKVVDVVQRAEIPNGEIRAIDYPGSPVVLYALRTAELEAGLRRIKKHRQQLDKAAERAAAKAKPAPAASAEQAPPAPPASPESDAATGSDSPAEPLDAFGQPLSAWQTVDRPAAGEHPATEPATDRDATLPTDDELQDTVHALLQFTPPPTSGGKYLGRSPAQYQRQQEHRALAIQVAAQAVLRHAQRQPLPPLQALAPLINRMAIEGGELFISFHELACLLGHRALTDPADVEALGWADALPPDQAALVAVLQLCLQDTTGDDAFARHAEAVADAMSIPTADLWATAKASVVECLQLGALATGKKAGKACTRETTA